MKSFDEGEEDLDFIKLIGGKTEGGIAKEIQMETRKIEGGRAREDKFFEYRNDVFDKRKLFSIKKVTCPVCGSKEYQRIVYDSNPKSTFGPIRYYKYYCSYCSYDFRLNK